MRDAITGILFGLTIVAVLFLPIKIGTTALLDHFDPPHPAAIKPPPLFQKKPLQRQRPTEPNYISVPAGYDMDYVA